MGQNRGPSDKVLVSFNAGELSPLLDSRSDLDKAASGCRTLENMIVETYGSARRRPGTQFIALSRTGDPPDEPEEEGPTPPPNRLTGDFRAAVGLDSGQVIVGSVGPFYRDAVELPNVIYRLNADISIDTDFDAPSFTGNVGWLFLQPSGKILVVGYGVAGLTAAETIQRLNTDGSQDTGYVPDAAADFAPDDYIVSAAMLSDGRLVFHTLGLVTFLLGVNGAADAGFPTDFNFVGGLAAAGLKFAGWDQHGGSGFVQRYAATGVGDLNYNPSNIPNFLAMRSDGSMLMMSDGFSGNPNANTLYSFSAAGAPLSFPALEDTFGGGAPVPLAPGLSQIVVSGANYILVVGVYGTLRKVTPSGAYLYFSDLNLNGEPRFLTVNADGTMWLVGLFSAVNGFDTHGIIKLDSNGFKIG
jgi:hypothetical protein